MIPRTRSWFVIFCNFAAHKHYWLWSSLWNWLLIYSSQISFLNFLKHFYEICHNSIMICLILFFVPGFRIISTWIVYTSTWVHTNRIKIVKTFIVQWYLIEYGLVYKFFIEKLLSIVYGSFLDNKKLISGRIDLIKWSENITSLKTTKKNILCSHYTSVRCVMEYNYSSDSFR